MNTKKNSLANYVIGKRLIDQNASLQRCGLDILQINDQRKAVSEIVKFFRKRLMY